MQDIIESKKYEEALAIVNFKGKLTKYIAKQTIVDNYPDRVLGLIRSNPAGVNAGHAKESASINGFTVEMRLGIPYNKGASP